MNAHTARVLEELRRDRNRLLAQTVAGGSPRAAGLVGVQPPGVLRWGLEASCLLTHLVEAVRAAEPRLFLDQVAWLKTYLAAHGLPANLLPKALAGLASAARTFLSQEAGSVVGPLVEEALRSLPALGPEPVAPPFQSGPRAPLAQAYLEALLQGDSGLALQEVLLAVHAGTPLQAIYLEVLQPAQRELGRLWLGNQVTVAQEHYCTAAAQLVLAHLQARIAGRETSGRRMVAACVEGEQHGLGIRVVADFFAMEGWETYCTGASTPDEAVVQAVFDQDADLLGLSASRTPLIPKVANLITRVRAAASQGGLQILVGGRPFELAPDLWRAVGADGQAADASLALAVASRLPLRARRRGSGRHQPGPVGLGDRPTRSGANPAGPFQPVAGLAQVSSELALLHRELAQRNGQLENLNILKNQLLGMAAHDLRHPLMAIQSAAEILALRCPPRPEDGSGDAFALIRHAVAHMRKLLDNLLDVARVEAGALELERVPVDLLALAREQLRWAAPKAAQFGVELELAPAAASVQAQVDPTHITQVVANLLENALKFTPSGGRVTLGVRPEGEEAWIWVTDQGPGIPPETLETCFAPFQKGQAQAPVHGSPGAGLGLAIVRKVVAAHGGRTWVESQAGAGATFHVALPIQGPGGP